MATVLMRVAGSVTAAAVLSVALAAPTPAVPEPTVRTQAAVTFASTVRVPLSSAWRITLSTQLRAAAAAASVTTPRTPAITCSVRGLVRAAGRPATAAVVRCTGPVSAPGRSYRVRLTRASTGALLTSATMRFAQPTFATTSAMTAVAPLPPFRGVMASHGGVGFFQPTGWARTDYDDAVRLVGESDGARCEVFIFHPVAADTSTGSASLWAQLRTTTQALFGTTPIYGEYGDPNYLHTRQWGRTGYGSPWVGLTLQAGESSDDEVQAYLIRFGTMAVQVVAHSLNFSGCGALGPFTAPLAQIFHTLNVPGQPMGAPNYATSALGEWEMITTSMGALYALGANGHYSSVVATQWPVELGGILYDRTSAWFGSGSYVLRGPVLATFPASGSSTPSSSLIRIFNEARGVERAVRMCETEKYYDGSMGEACWTRSA